MSTEVTVYSSASDGHMYAKTADHFSNARDAASAGTLDVSSDTMRVGLGYISPPDPGDKYRFYRMALYFDTSSIPDGATITAATLSLYLKGTLNIIPQGFDLVLMKDTDETYPHDGLVAGDFDREHYIGGGATGPTIIGGAPGYKAFPFTVVGKALWINKEGTSKFIVLSSLDVGYTIPNYSMLADFHTQEKGGSYRPKLVIEYSTPCTVTAQAASSITVSGATGNGNVTDAGSETVTSRGVIWNDDGTDPVDLASADNFKAAAAGGTGAFTAAITGCDAETSYYYRAYGTTSDDSSYGSAVQFTTIADSTILAVTTQATTDPTMTTATANGTIVEDAGHDVTEYGFVYKLGSDPGTPADPADADNYTDDGSEVHPAEMPFTSDLTGLTAESVYFIRAYATTSEDGTAYGGLDIFRTAISAGDTTVEGETGDGRLRKDFYKMGSPCTAGTVDAASADSVITNETTISLQSRTYVSGYCFSYTSRAYLYFDTSGLSGKTVTNIDLKLYMVETYYYNGANFAYNGLQVLQNAAGAYPSESGGSPALAVGDFDKTKYTQIATVAAQPGIYPGPPVNTWFTISLPISSVNTEGLTKLCIMVYDPAEMAAYSSQTVSFHSADGANKPYLDIDYLTPQTPVFPKANIGDVWVEPEGMVVNIGDEWIPYEDLYANRGDSWG